MNPPLPDEALLLLEEAARNPQLRVVYQTRIGKLLEAEATRLGWNQSQLDQRLGLVGETLGLAPLAMGQAGKRPATLKHAVQAASGLRWLWPSWIQRGAIVGLASEPGIGKTRLAMDLVRRIRTGEPWPDDQPMEHDPTMGVLWVAADANHSELGQLANDYGIDPETIYLNTSDDKPFDGVSLECDTDIRALETRCQQLGPGLVVVDTVGAVTSRDLTRNEEAKALFGPLSGLAVRQQVTVLVVTHLSAAGTPLGRRITQHTRQMLKLEMDGPKRKLSVLKSNSAAPAALLATYHDAGVDYEIRPDPSLEAAMSWLLSMLRNGPRLAMEINRLGADVGFTRQQLFRARERLAVQVDGNTQRSTWMLRSSL